MTSPLQWLWRACLILFGCTILLNLTVSYLQPILPWLLGGIGCLSLLWVVTTVIRWRQSRW